MIRLALLIAGVLFLVSVTLNVLLFSITKPLTKIGSNTLAETSNKIVTDKVYIQSLLDRIVDYEKRIANLEAKNEENSYNNDETAKKIMCLELVKKTPDSGPGRYIGTDIIGYYKEAKERYDSIQQGDYSRNGDKEDNLAEKKFWTDIYNKAKPLYENYIKLCQ